MDSSIAPDAVPIITTKSPAGPLNDSQTTVPIGPLPKDTPSPVSSSGGLVGYRDYLRSIFTGPPDNPQYYATYRDQLASRFHQDFETVDQTRVPANQGLIIPIVVSILTAPVGSGYGFGINPAAITAWNKQTTSARSYLDYLIGLSGLSAQDLGLQFRIDLQRSESALSSPVEENIHTLQRFYTDSFQSPADAVPIIPQSLQGKPPFFLEYGEWVLSTQQPFFAENLYPIRQFRIMNLNQPQLDLLTSGGFRLEGGDNLTWFLNIPVIDQKMAEADASFYQRRYQEAWGKYVEIENSLWGMLAYTKSEGNNVTTTTMVSLTQPVLDKFGNRKTVKVANPEQIGSLLDYWIIETRSESQGWVTTDPNLGIQVVPRFTDFFNEAHDSVAAAIIYLLTYVLPGCFGDVAMAMGDCATAVEQYGRVTRFIIAHAIVSDSAGYDGYIVHTSDPQATWPVYKRGQLPYSADLNAGDSYPDYAMSHILAYYQAPGDAESFANLLIKDYTNPVEAGLFRLRQGEAILQWADSLYRTDEPSSIARARELYKAVMSLHGDNLPVVPSKPLPVQNVSAPFIPSDGGGSQMALTPTVQENPAVTSQKARARLGFYQIERGLNYYGYADDMVPVLRYRPLKAAADAFAASAKSTQTDFLTYMAQLESQLLQNLAYSNMLTKTALQKAVADQQVFIANDELEVAKIQRAQVDDEIARKQQELADSQSFGAELGSFLTSLIDISKGASGFLTSLVAGSGSQAVSSVTQSELQNAADSAVQAAQAAERAANAYRTVLEAGYLDSNPSITGGILSEAAWTGAGVLAGFGVFVALAYYSMNSFAQAEADRAAALGRMKDYASPAAEAQIDSKTRALTIAGIQQQIAQADATFAAQLVNFQATRFLNVSFWADAAWVVQRVMRRHLELAARTAWFAERALSYEQGRDVNTVRFDYFPVNLQGVTGADLLILDLANLEAARLEGIQEMVPIKHTFSMVRDFPLQFGKLKATGSCSFFTQADPLRYAYPGTYNHRIKAVSIVALRLGADPPPRGLLRNGGFSLVSDLNPGQQEVTRTSLRPPAALPLSDFRLTSSNMVVYGMPGETLLAFEGSGVETEWTLDFPSIANPYGLDNLADILITLDVQARYAPQLYATHLSSLPSSITRLILVSALLYQPTSIQDLVGKTKSVAVIDFDMSMVPLPKNELNRKVNNIVLLAYSGGQDPFSFGAMFSSSAPPATASIQFQNGICLSNAPPLYDGKSPQSPLNAMAGDDVMQKFSLKIDKGSNPGVDFGKIMDVVLGIDYSADIK